MMTVYVGPAVWPYRRMVMCHMFADSLDELNDMADKIGVSRKWFQRRPGFNHYDICKSKRSLTIRYDGSFFEHKWVNSDER